MPAYAIEWLHCRFPTSFFAFNQYHVYFEQHGFGISRLATYNLRRVTSFLSMNAYGGEIGVKIPTPKAAKRIQR